MPDAMDAVEDDVACKEPDHLTCPITHLLFQDPVFVAESGNTYERDAIVKFWSTVGRVRDPLTNVDLSSSAIHTNWSVRRNVQQFLDAHPKYVPQGWSGRVLSPPAIPAALRRRKRRDPPPLPLPLPLGLTQRRLAVAAMLLGALMAFMLAATLLLLEPRGGLPWQEVLCRSKRWLDAAEGWEWEGNWTLRLSVSQSPILGPESCIESKGRLRLTNRPHELLVRRLPPAGCLAAYSEHRGLRPLGRCFAGLWLGGLSTQWLASSSPLDRLGAILILVAEASGAGGLWISVRDRTVTSGVELLGYTLLRFQKDAMTLGPPDVRCRRYVAMRYRPHEEEWLDVAAAEEDPDEHACQLFPQSSGGPFSWILTEHEALWLRGIFHNHTRR